MSNTLLLFLFSGRVDPYINAIAHTFDNMQVTAVRLMYVRGTKTGLTDSEASAVSNHIWTQIQSLASGYYTDFSTQGEEEQPQNLIPRHPLKQIDKLDIYKRINERLLDRQLIPLDYSNLKEGLSQIIRRQSRVDNCIIDLTAATKVPSVDIFSICLAIGVNSVYTFELANRPDPKNAENFLYHALKSDDFSYTCMSDTPPVRASRSSLLRRSSLLWSVSIVALFVLLVSLYLLVTLGSDSLIIQLVNLSAAVITIASSLIALFEQHKKS